MTNTIRQAYVRTITVSPHDPDAAFVGSWDGYIWKTIDGGRTWVESRLIVERFPFFGDGGQRIYFGVHRSAGGSSAASDPASENRQGKSRHVAQQGQGGGDGGGGGGGGGGSGGAAANVNFGIGVPGGAPRLQLLVRKMGKTTSGLNIKQTLALRGSRSGEVRLIVVHPRNPDVVFACTTFGLFKTYDGGITWVRTFTGTSDRDRFATHVAIDPSDDNKVFLATGDGLYLSTDGGESFMKSTAGGVGGGFISWIYFHPQDSRYVFASGDAGLLRSSDGGQNWQWLYYTTFPAARFVHQTAPDPFDKNRGYIATWDGIFATDELLTGGLESWRRLGGLMFTGINVLKVTACPRHRGHLWAATIMRIPSPTSAGNVDTGGAYIYESLDGGETWNVIFSGETMGSMQWFDNDRRDPDLLWIAWSRAISRMRRLDPSEPASAQPVIPDDPPLGEVLTAALRHTGVEPGLQLAYRRRSLYKSFVPKLQAGFGVFRWRDYGLWHDAPFYALLPYRGRDSRYDHQQELRVVLSWDLSDLVFNLNTTLFGRIDRISGEIRGSVTYGVQRFYGELRRLRATMANRPPEDLRVRLAYKLRIEELTSYLDFISGGYLTRWQRGDRPSGSDTKWWKPWRE